MQDSQLRGTANVVCRAAVSGDQYSGNAWCRANLEWGYHVGKSRVEKQRCAEKARRSGIFEKMSEGLAIAERTPRSIRLLINALRQCPAVPRNIDTTAFSAIHASFSLASSLQRSFLSI